MRTILNQLKKQSLITSSRGGHALTAKGRRALGKPLKFMQVDAGNLTVGEVDVATIVRGAAAKVKKGIEQRDEAIKAGADGATVLVFKAGKLQFPDGFTKVDEKVGKIDQDIWASRWRCRNHRHRQRCRKSRGRSEGRRANPHHEAID